MAWPTRLTLLPLRVLNGAFARGFASEAATAASTHAAPSTEAKTAPSVKLLPALSKAPMPIDLTLQVLQSYAIHTETIDIHVQVSMTDKNNKTKLREPIQGVALLPHGFRPEKRVAVFAKGEQADAAREAGAQFVGDADLIDKVSKGEVKNVDVFLSTPEMLRDLRPISRILRQSMPTVKKGTVDSNVASRVAVFKRGSQFKSDDAGNILAAVAKTNFSKEAIKENLVAFINAVLTHNQTPGAPFVRKVHLASTQSPAFLLDMQSLMPNLEIVTGAFKRPKDKKTIEKEKKAEKKSKKTA